MQESIASGAHGSIHIILVLRQRQRRDARDWAKIILRETAELQFGNYRELPNCLSTYRFTWCLLRRFLQRNQYVLVRRLQATFSSQPTDHFHRTFHCVSSKQHRKLAARTMALASRLHDG